MHASGRQANAFGIQHVTARILGPNHNFAASGAAACAA